MTAIYTICMLAALTGLTSLGVDWGHVQLTKTQLLAAADAAARAAASQLSNGITATQNAAVTWGGYCTADGSSVVINSSSDIDFGTWNTSARTFTVLSGSNRSSANAVRVWARRTAARGTAVNLTFGAVIGFSTCDVNESAIAYISPGGANYSLVGMNSVMLQNNTILTDSYNAATGAYNAATAGTYGEVASNGSITLGGTVTVKQNLYMQSGQSLTTNGSVSYGSRQTLSSPLVCPTPSAGSYATSNSNAQLGLPTSGANASFSSGSYTVPSGTYYINSFSMSGGTITCSGPVTIYMNGNFSITGGSFTTYNNLPTNLTIKMVTSAGVTLSGVSSCYADIQAPTSPINISGVANLYGRYIGSTLNVSGSANLHADTSLPAISGASSGPGGSSQITSVQ